MNRQRWSLILQRHSWLQCHFNRCYRLLERRTITRHRSIFYYACSAPPLQPVISHRHYARHAHALIDIGSSAPGNNRHQRQFLLQGQERGAALLRDLRRVRHIDQRANRTIHISDQTEPHVCG